MTNNLKNFVIISISIHAIIISLLSIKWYTNIRQSTKSIDVTLVKQETKHNNPTDFLAQKSTTGGGQAKNKNAPKSRSEALFPDKTHKEIKRNFKQSMTINNTTLQAKQENSQITTNKLSKQKVADNKNNISNKALENNEPIIIFQTETKPEISSLIHEIEQRAKLYAKRSKKRFISASTQEYRDAEYIDKWRKKIEYFGNKYYPKQAKQRNLSGKVLMLVAIKSNGELEKVRIEQSSGIKILDEAAIQAVHLAAPFEPFTAVMRKDTDTLEIIRTWRFNQDGNNSNFELG
jgi:protein TonB